MSCYVKPCTGSTIIIFNNLLLCDNPFNVLFQEEKKEKKKEEKFKVNIGVQLKLR